MNNSRPKAKLSRALGIPLTRKCVKYFERRPFPPGVHGRARRKSSDYQVRLLEKQRLRHQYNISEVQMRAAYDAALGEDRGNGAAIAAACTVLLAQAPGLNPSQIGEALDQPGEGEGRAHARSWAVTSGASPQRRSRA